MAHLRPICRYFILAFASGKHQPELRTRICSVMYNLRCVREASPAVVGHRHICGIPSSLRARLKVPIANVCGVFLPSAWAMSNRWPNSNQ